MGRVFARDRRGLTMMQTVHEIRDPIHIFVRMDGDERRVLDSRPFQRLRDIHQLAMTYFVYPGATHKRFEHSLGVMELAGRVFDIVTNRDNVVDDIRDLLPETSVSDKKRYWRRVVRMAALCHDIGHLPFSHAAEKALLPEGWDHEKLTRTLISSDGMKEIWSSMTPPLRHEDIEKLAVGPKKASDLGFSDWETILAEIIVGDAFGVDRMDYLLRDSHHAGVAYGKFDHHRLIDTLRILPPAQSGNGAGSKEPALGMEEGGLQSAEALMLARYFMYSQVYFHPVRRIYDIHLTNFLKEWLRGGCFSTCLKDHLKMTDSKVAAALWKVAYAEGEAGYEHARRIVRREHFKRVYERNPEDIRIHQEPGRTIYEALSKEYGEEYFEYDHYNQQSGVLDFPIRMRDGRIVSSYAMSETLQRIPVVAIDRVYSNRDHFSRAEEWVKKNRQSILEEKRDQGKEDGQT